MTESQFDRDNNATERARENGCSSTTTLLLSTMSHGTGRVLDPQDMEAIRTGYIDIFGVLNGYRARDIEWAIEHGVTASGIIDAMEQTAFARRPTHQYFKAILRRYVTQGIYTAEDAERDRERWRLQREAANRETWGSWYKDPADDFPF